MELFATRPGSKIRVAHAPNFGLINRHLDFFRDIYPPADDWQLVAETQNQEWVYYEGHWKET